MWILGKVIDLNEKLEIVGPSVHVECDSVLEGAKEKLQEVLLLGKDIEGEYYFASSTGNKGKLLLLIERFKYDLMAGVFDE